MVESHVALPVRTFIDSTDQSQMPLTVKESVKKLLKTKFQDGSLLKQILKLRAKSSNHNPESKNGQQNEVNINPFRDHSPGEIKNNPFKQARIKKIIEHMHSSQIFEAGKAQTQQKNRGKDFWGNTSTFYTINTFRTEKVKKAQKLVEQSKQLLQLTPRSSV